jgi:capsular polysaccharide biosynthesis protein
MNFGELLTYWQVIKKRLWLIGLLVGVTLGAMLLISYLAQPVYKATTSFQVTTPLPAEVSLYSEFRTSTSRDELRYTRNNFVAVLQSNFVVGQVIEGLGLEVDVEDLQERMVILTEEDSDFVTLEVTAEDPKEVAAIANALTEYAARYFGQLSAGSLTADKELIQQQLQEVKEDLDAAREALIQFQLENRVGMVDQVLTAQQTLIRQLSFERDQALAQGDPAKASAYDEIITQHDRELQGLILLSSEYDLLNDRAKRIEATYSSLLDKETEAMLKENEILSARFIRVIPAREPSHPLSRFNAKVLLLGGIVSLAVGIMLAFALAYLDRVGVTEQADVTLPKASLDLTGMDGVRL